MVKEEEQRGVYFTRRGACTLVGWGVDATDSKLSESGTVCLFFSQSLQLEKESGDLQAGPHTSLEPLVESPEEGQLSGTGTPFLWLRQPLPFAVISSCSRDGVKRGYRTEKKSTTFSEGR